MKPSLAMTREMKPEGQRRGRGYQHKFKVLTLVDRDSGQARSVVIDEVNAKTIGPIVRKNAREAKLMTDEASYYKSLGVELRNAWCSPAQHRRIWLW